MTTHPYLKTLAHPKLGDVKGFSSAGIAAGLKRSGKLDLGILFSDRPCSAAGLFTQNRFPAAPVVYDREVLRRRASAVRAVVVNSGHANAATGPRGMDLARRTAAAVERCLGISAGTALVCSTGIIGDLPNEMVLRRGIEMASGKLTGSDTDFQKSILTTDKVEKVAGVCMTFSGGREARLIGVTKGSGMIAPNMATMLAFIATDAGVSPAFLKTALRAAAFDTFNSVSVDGDTSTNDTVLVLANGAAGVRIRGGPRSIDGRIFAEGLREICARLAWKLAEDGEGATKVVEVVVEGAKTSGSAKQAAKTVSESLLVKTAMHGEDPNVGRVLAALGRSGVKEIRPDRVDVYFNGIRAVRLGVVDRTSSPLALRNALRPKVVRIKIDLHVGRSSGKYVTCDLSSEYVRINAEYRT